MTKGNDMENQSIELVVSGQRYDPEQHIRAEQLRRLNLAVPLYIPDSAWTDCFRFANLTGTRVEQLPDKDVVYEATVVQASATFYWARVKLPLDDRLGTFGRVLLAHAKEQQTS